MKKFWIAITFILVAMMGSNGVVNASEYEAEVRDSMDILLEAGRLEPEEKGYITEDVTRLAPEIVDATVGDVAYKVYTLEDGTLALYSCSSQVETLVIPESINGITVTGIGEYFWEHSTLDNLKVVEIPDTVTSLGGHVFRGCTTLTKVKLPEGLKELTEYCFYGCTALQSVEIPDSITILGWAAFYGCESLTEIELPSELTTVEPWAFALCTNLKGVEVPSAVTSIGQCAFYRCSSLETVNLSDAVTFMGEYAFSACTSLREFRIPQGITELSKDILSHCTSLKEIKITSQVTSIPEWAFGGCSSLEKVYMPDTVTFIGEWAFSNCKSITELTIPDSVTTIGRYAFYGCESITEFRIPAGVTTIDDWAFSHCYSLKSFEFPKGIKVLEDHVLSTSPALESVTIPDSVTSINYRAFFGCDALKTIKIPKGVENIGEEAFIYCYLLEDIVIPKTVKNIGTDAFKGTATGMRVHCIKYSYADNSSLYPEGVVFVYEEDVSPLREFVERMYTVALGREADEDGADFWEEKLLNRSRDGAGLAQGFILSPEFKGYNYGDSKYIEILYKTFFNRAGDQSGISYWADAISAGTSREAVLAGFVNSVEFDDLCTYYGISRGVLREDGNALNPGIVLFAKRLYTKILGREGDKSGVEYWAIQLADGISTPEEAARNFFFGDEYLAKNTSDADYIRALYLTFMDREADAAGLEYWKGMLSSGVSRESALAGFAASPEFRAIMVEYGL